MENPSGRVIAIHCGESLSHALVEVDVAVQCARCAKGRGCGAGVFGSSAGKRRVDAQVAAGLAIEQGDEVRIELPPRNLLQASLILYGVPLFTAVSAVFAAHLAGFGELFAVLASIAGLVTGMLVARFQLRNTGCLRRFRPTIVARIADRPITDGRTVEHRAIVPDLPPGSP